MKTVFDNIEETIINKSKFVCCFFKIDNINEVNIKINYIKQTYKNATHYCYAYVIDNKIKASDDGEPSGTAGLPILNVLQKEHLNHVLCIVVRYFGGIKLGAGGLIRAYTKSVTNGLKIIEYKKYINIELIFDKKNLNIINNLLKNIEIKKKFTNQVIYNFDVEINEYIKIKDSLTKLGNIKEKNTINKN